MLWRGLAVTCLVYRTRMFAIAEFRLFRRLLDEHTLVEGPSDFVSDTEGKR